MLKSNVVSQTTTAKYQKKKNELMRPIANGLGAEAHGSLDVALRNQARIEHNNLKNAITYIKVPKGTEVTWIAGKARW